MSMSIAAVGDEGRVPAAAAETVAAGASPACSRTSSSAASSKKSVSNRRATAYSKHYRSIIAAEVALEDSLSATIVTPEQHPVRLISIRKHSDQDFSAISSDILVKECCATMDESELSETLQAPEGFADDKPTPPPLHGKSLLLCSRYSIE